MMLFIDETENKDYFIVVGLLVKNKLSVENAYKHFKKKINNFPIKSRSKELIYREFKSIILDKHYQKIKSIMLDEINGIGNYSVIYSLFKKEQSNLIQVEKEKTYINLLIKIAIHCGKVSIVYDGFNNQKFESVIEQKLQKITNVDSVVAGDSQEEIGLQLVDNLCSVIRLHVSKNDRYNFYGKIASKVYKI